MSLFGLLVLAPSLVVCADQDFDLVVERLLGEVEADPQCTNLSRSLLAYANQQVEQWRSEIKQNVDSKGARTFDVLWPGFGYNNVANGGSYQVLTQLEKLGVLKVGRLMGASGGAASALLAVADATSSGATLLKYYMVYAKWAEQTSDMQVLKQTHLWSAIYRRLIRDDAVFSRVKERAWAAASCGPQWSNSVLYNYETREQCVQAFYASGDCSLQGLTVATSIDDMFWRLGGTCSDGGSVTYFPQSEAALMVYSADYGLPWLMTCHLESIRDLFRRGVDQTIQALRSGALRSEHVGAVIPAPGARVDGASYAATASRLGLGTPCTYFYDVGGGVDASHSCFWGHSTQDAGSTSTTRQLQPQDPVDMAVQEQANLSSAQASLSTARRSIPFCPLALLLMALAPRTLARRWS